MRSWMMSLVIFAFSVPVFGASYVPVLKCGGDDNRFELFLDKEDAGNALYSYKDADLHAISEVQTRRLNLVDEKGDESTRLAISYTKADDSILYDDITKKLDIKLAGAAVNLDCTLLAGTENKPTLYKINKL